MKKARRIYEGEFVLACDRLSKEPILACKYSRSRKLWLLRFRNSGDRDWLITLFIDKEEGEEFGAMFGEWVERWNERFGKADSMDLEVLGWFTSLTLDELIEITNLLLDERRNQAR